MHLHSPLSLYHSVSVPTFKALLVCGHSIVYLILLVYGGLKGGHSRWTHTGHTQVIHRSYTGHIQVTHRSNTGQTQVTAIRGDIMYFKYTIITITSSGFH